MCKVKLWGVPLLLLLLLSFGGESAQAKPSPTIAVMPFRDLTGKGKSHIGEAIREVVASDLKSLSGVRIVERGSLDKVLKEMRLQSNLKEVEDDTAAKLGTAESWRARIDAIKRNGLDHIADDIMERWFAPAFRSTSALTLWRNMLIRTPADGYVAACTALSRADQTEATAGLRIPALVVAGEADDLR